MSRSFFAIVLFSFMALAQAVVLPVGGPEGNSVQIITPGSGTILAANSTQIVTWLPPSAGHFDLTATADILLGVRANNYETLCTNTVLAKNVRIEDGSAIITLPNVPEDDYFIAITGEYGARSDPFQITGGSGINPCPYQL